MRNDTLFDYRSRSTMSPKFLVAPGSAVLISGFGFSEDDYASVLKVVNERGQMPSAESCAPMSIILNRPTTEIVDSASVCCEWALTKFRNMLVIPVPGVYMLALSNEEMLGNIRIEAVQLSQDSAAWIPPNMVFGSADCDCCGQEESAITCADLQALFNAGSPARYLGIDAAGRCVTGAPPAFNETPLITIDSNTIDFTNNGTMGHTVTGNVKVSGDSGNSVQIRGDGLYVPTNTETPFIANDSGTIDFTTSGPLGHILTGTVRISGDVGNLISLHPDGLYVTAPSVAAQTPLTVIDTQTVNLTSSGEYGHTVSADVKVSVGAGNRLVVNADGLYVPPITCADMSATFMAGTPYWIFGRDTSGNCVYGALPQVTFNETPLVAVDSSTIDFSTSGTSQHTITGVVRVSGAGGNRISVNADGIYSPPITCSDLLPIFVPGTPTQVLGRDASGNCVMGVMPSGGGGGTVDCATVRGLFANNLPKTPSVRLLAHDGTTCGEVDICALGVRPSVTFGGPSAAVNFSLADLKALCGSGSTNPEDDPVIFSTATAGWKGNGELSATPGVAYWPADTSQFAIVAGRAYVVTVMSVYPKFGEGPIPGNLQATFNYANGGAANVIDDPWSVPVQSGQVWFSAWVLRATASGNLSIQFNTTDNGAARTAYQLNWMITEARSTSGQPVTYSEAQQSGTRYSLQSAAPNNVLQTAFIPGVTQPYDLFVFGAKNVDDPAASGGPAAKGFAFSAGTVLATQYSSSLLASGGGARPANVAQAHAWSVNGQMNYGVNTNDLANATGATADDYRVAYKAFRFHAEITPGGGTPPDAIFQQAGTTVCSSDPCTSYASVVSMSGAQVTGSIPEDSAYRLVYRVNNADVGWFLFDNRGGATAKAVEQMLAGFEIPVDFAGGCATAQAEVRIECVQGNPAAASGGLSVGAYRMIHRSYPLN